MDALFENSPIFVPGSAFAKVTDHRAAERELRQGTFVPGNLTEDVRHEDMQEKGTIKHA
ncbi:hypothetical protein H0H81_002588 [Sphagnurus paluster]|uniref:Uncharacterized protein n=1 Tax=Sphagnurus paluster TaxID=117069 RepID=A0A9P7FTM6_9AGAR|nr:hypothetical protein H0H81_002588 [Sphagnurus paluster]